MYIRAGCQVNEPIGKVLHVENVEYVVTNYGYLQPNYYSGDDEYGERLNYLQALTRRFFRHTELFIEVTRDDLDVAKMAKDYRETPDKFYGKRMKGALLIGAVVKRCESLCSEIIAIHMMLNTLAEDDENIPKYKQKEAELNKTLDSYYQYFLQDDLKACLRLREGHEVIGFDKEDVLFKAAAQIFKTRAEGRNGALLYQFRSDEISEAMKSIDDVASQMRSMVEDGRDSEFLCRTINNFALAAKRRASIKGSDVGNYEEAVVTYDVSKRVIQEKFGSNKGIGDHINHGIRLIEYMAELREPLPKSCAHYEEVVEKVLDRVHG